MGAWSGGRVGFGPFVRGLLGTVVVAIAAVLMPGLAAGASKPRASGASTACPWTTSHASIAHRVAEVMSHMTIDDEIVIVEGHGTTNPYVFYMPGIPRLCIPALGEEDGPSGVADGLRGVTQLPAGVSLAATWDRFLGREYGEVIGAEEAGKGAAVNLGPTVNIDRDPRWGRSFEAYTEDPTLNAAMGVSDIVGVQSQRVMSQVKHYDAYNQETYRNTPQDDVIVSQRVLHEIYMPAFEAAVKDAKTASVMCAYSSVNGSFSCESRYLLTEVLKQLWNFPGFVTSDYGALHSTSGGALGGTDQEQPFNTFYGRPLEQAVRSGAIPRAVLNTMVQRMLTEMFRFDLISRPIMGSTSATVTTAAHQAISNQVADNGTVLLRNAGDALPLRSSGAGTIAVIGPAASVMPMNAGGGSAYVIPSSVVTPLQGIQAATGPGTTVNYQQGLPTDASLAQIPSSNLTPAYKGTPFGGTYTGTLTAPETGTYVLALTNPCGCYNSAYLYLDGRELIDNPSTPPVHTYSVAVNLTAGQTYSVKITGASSVFAWAKPSDLTPGIAAAVDAARSASSAVVVAYDDTESEATDRPGLDLPSAQNELISAVAAVNPHTIVVVDAGAPVGMPWLDKVAAVVDAWYPGQTNGTSLADILFGEVNPSGHLPVTFPRTLSQVPAASPERFPGVGGRVLYSEGLLVGYRWYDANDIPPLFPFGFGLSYTRFTFSGLRVEPGSAGGSDTIRVSARITNVGSRAGADVAQLYLGDPPAAGEPPRQLVGFEKVSLALGQSRQVVFTITPRDTWWWDDAAHGWNQSTGTYRVFVGDSSALADLPLRSAFEITSTPGARQVVISAPRSIRAGQRATVTVRLTASGNETLNGVRLSLQAPEGWSVRALGPTVFSGVSPSATPTATFSVEPPSWAPETNSVLHATADLGPAAQREAGVTVTVGG